jgi:hypothetical protein
MEFFKKIYRTEPKQVEPIDTLLPPTEHSFSYTLGGLVSHLAGMESGELSSYDFRRVIKNTFRLAFMYLVRNKAISIERHYYNQVFFGSLENESSKIIFNRNPDFPGFDQESPLLRAIYTAADGKTIGQVARIVLDGYMGPLTRHDRPLRTLMNAIFQGEMRGWRLSHDGSGWGMIVPRYKFETDPDIIADLQEAYLSAADGIRQMEARNQRLYRVGDKLQYAVMSSLSMRKNRDDKYRHHDRKKKRRRKKRDDNPRMWEA